jgi:hypothetical protein
MCGLGKENSEEGHTTNGSFVPQRDGTAFFFSCSTSRAAPIYQFIPKQNSEQSHDNAPNVLARPCNIKPQRRSSPSVLRRPVEIAGQSRHPQRHGMLLCRFYEADIGCIAELRERSPYVSVPLTNKARWFFFM